MPTRVVSTLVLLLLLSAAAVTLTGGLAKEVGEVVGLSDNGNHGLEHRRSAGVAAGGELHVRAAQLGGSQREHPGFRWVTTGGVLAVIGWVIASLAFALDVANFGSYDRPTAHWRAQSCCWSGCGSRTS